MVPRPAEDWIEKEQTQRKPLDEDRVPKQNPEAQPADESHREEAPETVGLGRIESIQTPEPASHDHGSEEKKHQGPKKLDHAARSITSLFGFSGYAPSELRRIARIYRTFFVSSFARELEFRANFFAKILQNLVWITFFLLIILVIFRNTNSIAGWTRGEVFVLAATCTVMNALSSAFFMSLMEIPEQVRRGTLDFVITKPIDTQFWVSTRKFNFDQLGTFVAGIVMIFYGLQEAQIQPDTAQIGAYGVLVLTSTALFYSLNLLLMTLGIWLVRVDNLWVLGETVMQVSRYPVEIFHSGLQRFFIYILPLGFIATVPTRILVRGVDGTLIALGLAWTVVAIVVSRWFWNFALRHYSSASS